MQKRIVATSFERLLGLAFMQVESRKPPNGFDVVNYWLQRLVPLIGSDSIFVAADRVGKEAFSLLRKGAEGEGTYCGSSCVIDLKAPKLLGMLNTTQEAVLVVDVK